MDQARFERAAGDVQIFRSRAASTLAPHPPTPPREQAREARGAGPQAPPEWIEFAHQKKPTAQRCAVKKPRPGQRPRVVGEAAFQERPAARARAGATGLHHRSEASAGGTAHALHRAGLSVIAAVP